MRFLITFIVALATTAPGVLGQGTPQAGGSLNGGLFRPPIEELPDSHGPNTPGGGGSGGLPPDGGVPPHPDDDASPPTPRSSPLTRNESDRALATRGSGTPPNRGESRRAGATSSQTLLPTDDDRWEVWWEQNKFDFIQLRRVHDAPYTGQGVAQETPEARERRLARVRATLREEIVPTLRGLTSSPDPSVRAHAAQALGKLRDHEGIGMLREMLTDSSFDVRLSAMLGLGIMESGHGSYLLLNIGDDTPTGRGLMGTTRVNRTHQGSALILSGLRGDRTAEPLIEQVLRNRSGHPELLTMACEAAGLMGSPATIRPLLDVALDESLPQYVRASSISALGRIGDPSVTPALVELLESDHDARRAAAVALGYTAHSGEELVIKRLARLLETETDAPTRHFAAITLGRIGGPSARLALLGAFEDPAADMRPWLALGLAIAERNAPRGDLVDTLIERIEDESNANTLSAYLIALGMTSSEKGLAVLAEHTQARQVEVAGYAAMGLGLTGQPAAEPILRDLIRSSGSPFMIRQTAFGLGILGDTSSIPDLVEIIRTTNNPFVASSAALGISLMGDAEAAGALLDVIERKGNRGVTTTFAVAAVGQLFDTDRRPVLSNLAAGSNHLARIGPVDSLLDLGF
jgi:HEAT repeat protein